MFELKTWALAAPVVIALLSGAAHGQIASGDGGRIKPVIDSTVRVLALLPNGTTNMGTGWVIEEADRANRAGGAIVVTARHLVNGAVKVTIVEPGSSITDQRAAVVHAATPERDLAFLEVKDIAEPALTITRSVPNVGDTVRGIGYSSASDENEANGRAVRASPKLGGLSKVFRGNIGPGASAPIDQIEFDAPILPGFSGGALVNDCGQVIGVMVKDGGHIRLGEGHQIATASGVALAVASDEIITAARDAGINLTVTNSVCDAHALSTTPPAPPPTPCSKPFITSENGRGCIKKPPTPLEKVIHSVGGPTGALVIVALLALAVILGTLAMMFSRRRAYQGGGIAVAVAPAPALDTSQPFASLPSSDTPSAPPAPRSIRLTGRAPLDDVIDLRFTAEELAGPGLVLGVEGDDRAKIPDRRKETHVSRRHANLRFDGRNFVVIDLKSSNGTKVSGERLTPNVPRYVVSGDRLELADVILNVTTD